MIMIATEIVRNIHLGYHTVFYSLIVEVYIHDYDHETGIQF